MKKDIEWIEEDEGSWVRLGCNLGKIVFIRKVVEGTKIHGIKKLKNVLELGVM